MRTTNAYFLALDIETSTIYEEEKIGDIIVKNPKAVWLAYGYINLYKANGEKIETNTFREWYELNDILKYYSFKFSKSKILCFVHNLSYEIDFLMKNISRVEKLLSNSTHRIICASLVDYKNIEFRCTFMLTGYSLRKLGQIVGLEKLESEYRTIYPSDDITKEELDYCNRDCDICAKYVSDILLKEYQYLTEIPYTKTGRVRKKLHKYYREDKRKKEWDMLPPENCYTAMVKAFNGGLCLSNPLFVGQKIKNVRCFDETSAYPYAMLKEEFPYTIRKEEDPSKFDLEMKFWIAKIRVKNIQTKFSWGWLSISKMESFGYYSNFFNGKLIESDEIERYVTNLDYEMILQTYTFDSIEILEFYPMEKYSKLPDCYIKTIEHYATLKGELKLKLKRTDLTDEERDETEKDYMLAKNDFNSIYGMTVQKLMQKEYTITENFEWKEITPKYQHSNKHIKRNFLIGIYVTSYARRNLLRAIIKNCPYTFIYGDTDSIKFIGNNKFIDTNEPLFEYQNNPHIKNLGQFDEEATYDLFKNFGAKKYYHQIGDRGEMTVAGLPRTETCKNIDDFACGKEFLNCKLGTKYFYANSSYELSENGNIIETNIETDLLLFYEKNRINTNGGVMLYPTSYRLDMTVEDKNYIKIIQGKDAYIWHEKIKLQTGIDLTEFVLTA